MTRCCILVIAAAHNAVNPAMWLFNVVHKLVEASCTERHGYGGFEIPGLRIESFHD